eukprot:TRINITY_DN5593_c0_g1_i4.p1 TRINITY_DN5593_c0_g1~~TRINITY_DN5593_c0_g1_i4.p1  ORF type:complete len:798 (-),score=223.60 TRINITY_DN5593_c0_g1_i4:79-2472(-)
MFHVNRANLNSRIICPSRVSFATQHPFLFIGTVRENILFGNAYDPVWYKKVVEAAQLLPDFEALPSGDETLVGEHGVNLSGGQRSRVCIARAVYAQSDAFFFDYSLSSLDATVARKVFNACLGPNGLLAGKTRILVTNMLQTLYHADFIVEMEDFCIKRAGTFGEFLNHHVGFEDYTSAGEVAEDFKVEGKELEIDDVLPEAPSRRESVPQIISKEMAQGAEVTCDTYSIFVKNGGGIMALLSVIVLFLAGQAVVVCADFFVINWTTATDQSNSYYLYVMLAFVGGIFVLCIARAQAVSAFIFRSCSKLHDNAVKALLLTSIDFFESNPVGRIMNRLSQDLATIDTTLPFIVLDGLHMAAVVIGVIVVIAVIFPYLIILVVVIGISIGYFQGKFVATSQQVRRFLAVSRSPVLAGLQASMEGAAVIRSYKQTQYFSDNFIQVVDENSRMSLNSWWLSLWFGLRVDLISGLLACAVCLVAVLFMDSLDYSYLAISIIYSLKVGNTLQLSLRSFVEVQVLMTSYERLCEYETLEPEENPLIESKSVDEHWPRSGHIEVDKLHLRYKTSGDFEDVLKGVSFSISDSEKIGVCGRTGAGKSSLFKCFFRTVDITGGKILIDNLDISHIKLSTLRSRLSIIPQEPVIFADTLRFNLDPKGMNSDDEVVSALATCGLESFLGGSEVGSSALTRRISASSLSEGQKHLLCLARAWLLKSRVLFIDEATANLDKETDALILQILNERFHDRTVVAIAHRLQTILSSSRVLVLEQGRLSQFDSPANLLADKDGLFSTFVHDNSKAL